MGTGLEIAKRFLHDCGYTMVVAKEWVELVSLERGLLPLLMIYDKCPAGLDGAVLADKVIGKAAALILAETKIGEVYADVMSQSAIPVLKRKQIKFSYGKLVPEILNHDRSDLCPMEKLCRDIEKPLDGIMAITGFICRNRCCDGDYRPKDMGNCNCT